MKRLIIIISILCSTALYGQNIKRPDSYNYTRGVEAIQNENTKEALEYLNKEIEENPDNGYAYSWIALVRNYNEEYGGALLAADRAVKLISKKDKEYWIFAYLTRANVFKGLEKNDYALQDYNTVLKEYPDCSDALENRAQLYYEQEQFELANKDYKKLISIERGNTIGYMGLGRNANAQNKFQDAIKQFDYVIKLAPDYSSGYSFRAESYIGLKKWYEAVDDIIMALSIDYDNKAFYLMQNVADSAYSILVSKFKIQKLKSPNNNSWTYYLGVINEYTEKYDKAATFYKEAFEKEASPTTAYRLSNCLDETGDYKNAIEYCKQAIKLDSTDYNYPLLLANIMDNAGKSKEAIMVLDKLIEKYPDFGFAYYRRGWIKDHTGDTDGAIEDYSMSITIAPTYAYTYLNRGSLWKLKGELSEAKKDFEQVIKLDSVPENADCSFYAYYYLGQKDKALEVLSSVLKDENKGNCYEAACLYSVMGEKEKAITYLEKSLKLGYKRFSHIRRDRDFNNIKNTEQFKQLINQYEKDYMRLESEEKETYSFINKTVEIPFTKEKGIYKVKCSINKLPLYFVFDTGATDISISSVEATFMLKNDYLKKTDIIGKQNYLTADGNICEGTVINLQSVDFGGLKLSNIRASVVHNQQAPLLLGQSVLNRLGTIEIDNSKCVLKITYAEKINNKYNS